MYRTVTSNLGKSLPQAFAAAKNALRDLMKDPRGEAGLSSIVPGLSLSARFAFVAAIVLCNGMALLGGWVATQIETGLLENAAASEAVYIRHLLEPAIPAIVSQDRQKISIEVASRLQDTPLVDPETSVAIWMRDGSIVYGWSSAISDRKAALPADVRAAFENKIQTSLSDENFKGLLSYQKQGAIRLVYIPLEVHGKVAAVAEVATIADDFKAQLHSIRKRTWIVVAIFTIIMILILFIVVQIASGTIEKQRSEIEQRLEEEIRLGEMNKSLSEKLQEANRRVIELGEEQLRRISSNLENGPAQLLGLALLRMYELKPPADQGGAGQDAVDVVAQATAGALKELQEISSGLLLPDLKGITSEEALEAAIRAHEQSTGTAVARNISVLPQTLPLPIAICIFRLVQEGLLNAYCHAGGIGQRIIATSNSEQVTVTVCDDGPGFSPEETLHTSENLGLRRLKQQVESLGGVFSIKSQAGAGTRLTAIFPEKALSAEESTSLVSTSLSMGS